MNFAAAGGENDDEGRWGSGGMGGGVGEWTFMQTNTVDTG